MEALLCQSLIACVLQESTPFSRNFMFGLFSLAKCIPYILIGYTRCGCECEAGLSPEHNAHGTVENILSKSALGSRMNWRSAAHAYGNALIHWLGDQTFCRTPFDGPRRKSTEGSVEHPWDAPRRECRAATIFRPTIFSSKWESP